MINDEKPRTQPVAGPEDWSYQTLLAVSGVGSSIMLRLGTVILTPIEPVWHPSTCIVLDDCQGDVAALRHMLQAMVGQQCDYVCDADGSYHRTTLWLDYEIDELEIQSRGRSEHQETISANDYKMQFARLSVMYRDAWREQHTSKRNFARFKSDVTAAIEKEADRSSRKYEFFKDTRADKAATYQVQHTTYRSVLARIAQVEKADEH